MKMHQDITYIAKGKGWDESDADEKDDYEYLAFIAISKVDSSNWSQVWISLSTAIPMSQYSSMLKIFV